MDKMKLTVIMCIAILCIASLAGLTNANDPSDYGAVQISLLNQNPDPAKAGDTFDLRLKVENIGSKNVNDLSVEVLPDYPFTIVSSPSIQKISSLDSANWQDNFVNLKYTILIDKNAMKGEQSLRVRYTFGTNQGSITDNFTITIVNKEYAQIIYVDKARLDPGKETPLNFTITNVGSAPLQNLVFSWSEPNGYVLPVYSDNTKYIRYLDVGESRKLQYTVIADVNANPGLYKLNLNLKAESLNNATPQEIITTAGVFIGGETDFDVAFSESSQGQTSLSVANTGNTPAESVSVRIPLQPGYRVTGSNSAIIGNLDKGDYTLVSFQISAVNASGFMRNNSGQASATNGAPRFRNNPQAANYANYTNSPIAANTLQVEIDYTDASGTRRSIVKYVPIQFRADSGTGQASQYSSGSSGFARSQSKTSFLTSTWFWLIVIVIAAAAGYLYWKRKKRNAELSNRKKRDLT